MYCHVVRLRLTLAVGALRAPVGAINFAR